jgi:hypothetical protein
MAKSDVSTTNGEELCIKSEKESIEGKGRIT